MQLAENLTQAKPEDFQRVPEQEEAISRFLQKSTVEPEEDSYPKEMRLSPDDIILTEGTQSRLHEDRDRIDDYARDMKADDWDFERRPLPEVLLAEDGRYYAIDCHHRVKAAILALHPGRMMLFMVRKGSLAQARIWSASANTRNGLAADNSPQGVRKRIEMFLDNIDQLTPEAYQEEFKKVPNLTEKELKYGQFSDRTIERYLRLRPGQHATVNNIRKERETAAKIMQHNVGDRVEISIPANLDPSKHPDGMAEGEAGTIREKDRKAIYVEWDRHPGSSYPINPDFIKPSDKPQPPPFNPPRHNPPNTSSTSGRSGEAPKSEAKSQPKEGKTESESAQSNIGLELKEGDRIEVSNPNCYCYGEQGEIGSFTDANRSNVIVFLDKGERILLRVVDVQAQAIAEVPSTVEEETVEGSEPEEVQAEEASFQEVREAAQLVCKNIPLLTLEEIEQLQGAIAAYHGSLDFAADKPDTEEVEEVTAKRCKHAWSDLYAEPSDPSFKSTYKNGMDAMRVCPKCGAIGKVSESGSILQLPQQKWAKHKQDAERWATNLGKFSEVQEAAQ